MSITCPLGKIERIGYMYKKKGKTINVIPTCVSDKGKPGKGPKLFVMPKYDTGLLSDYGYSLHSSHIDRVKAIKKSLKAHDNSRAGARKILQHINALRTLHKSNETYHKKLSKDLKWIQSYYDKL
jgi:hypothetical protein